MKNKSLQVKDEGIIAGVRKILPLYGQTQKQINNLYTLNHSNSQHPSTALHYWGISLLVSRSGKKVRAAVKELLHSGEPLSTEKVIQDRHCKVLAYCLKKKEKILKSYEAA